MPGTKAAMTIEPDENYVIPIGKARIALKASNPYIEEGDSLTIITHGMGVHWGLNAAQDFEGKVEILDLRSLNPLDLEGIYESVRRHNKCIVLTEETISNAFAESLAGRIASACFTELDAPIKIVRSR